MVEHSDRRPPAPDAMENGRTRTRTDQGRLGDKIPVSDPATAPLGTDTEAGGSRPRAADPRETAAGPQARYPEGQPQARYPEGQAAGAMPTRGFAMSGGLWALIGLVVIGVVVLLAAGLF